MLALVFTVVTKVLLYCLVLLLGLWCWFQVTNRKILRAAAKIQNPRNPLPIIGHAHLTMLGYEKVTQIILNMIEDSVSMGFKMMSFWCGPLPLFVVLDAQHIEKVLKSSITMEKSAEYENLKFFMREGLLTAPTNIWKVTSPYIHPLFHPRNLEHMVPVFNRNSQDLVTDLSKHVGGDPVNVFPIIVDLALKNVCNLTFSSKIHIDEKSKDFQGMRNVGRLTAMGFQRTILVWLRVEAVFQFFYKTELKNIIKGWENFIELLFQKASLGHSTNFKTYIAEEGDSHIQPSLAKQVNFFDAYKTLQRDFPIFSEADMKGELMTLFSTGSNTVGLATSSCFLGLARFPDIQDKVMKEILSVVGLDGDVTTQDLSKMQYLDQVYKETLRFFTVAAFISRKATEGIQLGEHTVPAGASLVVSLVALNKNPKIFSNPNDFDPDNFSPENKINVGKTNFVPFSAGPRRCPGKRYAEMMLKITIINVLRRFKLSTNMDVHNLKKKLSTTLICSEGYNISFENRN